MNTKILLASLATAGLATTAGLHSAHAENLAIGAQAQILPAGSVDIAVGDEDESFDLKTAFGIVGTVDYRVHPNFSVGAAPRLIFGVKPDEADEDSDSATQLDLAARLTGHFPVAPKIELFGYASPAYSFVFLPSEDGDDDEADDPSGFALGFGAGAAFKVTPALSVVGEIGYTLGFQGSSVETPIGDFDVDFKTSFPHVGIGIQAAL